MLHVEDSLLGACFIELFGCAVFGMFCRRLYFQVFWYGVLACLEWFVLLCSNMSNVVLSVKGLVSSFVGSFAACIS